ncbi:hypothetical protein, partial [Streptomyces brasiliscabiei]|uniref:hypothetical protein n=1 Tax=Streptomyces brasiliscabiei TaxID=2736302 RepID=UPI0038F5FBCB
MTTRGGRRPVPRTDDERLGWTATSSSSPPRPTFPVDVSPARRHPAPQGLSPCWSAGVNSKAVKTKSY